LVVHNDYLGFGLLVVENAIIASNAGGVLVSLRVAALVLFLLVKEFQKTTLSSWIAFQLRADEGLEIIYRKNRKLIFNRSTRPPLIENMPRPNIVRTNKRFYSPAKIPSTYQPQRAY